MDIQKSWNRLVTRLILYILFSIFSISVVTFAWFTLGNENNTELISELTDIEADYEFYVFKDSLHLGNPTPSLVEDTCILNEDQCYQLIPNPTEAHLFDGSVAPGERFSYAVKVRSQGQTQAYLSLEFGGVMSDHYESEVNKIQTAFLYEVTGITYFNNNTESLDMKSTEPIEVYSNYFSHLDAVIYPLVRNVPVINREFSSSTMIVYFDFYFSPTVFGSDSEGVPYTNSNIFMNQVLLIQHIFMKISLNPD